MKKQVNKSKEELRSQMQSAARVERMKVVARMIFPLLSDQKTIYDGQTVLNAAAGFIKQGYAEEADKILVKNVKIAAIRGEKTIKKAVVDIIEILKNEKADDAASILEKMGSSLGQYSAGMYLKNPMSMIKMDEFIA